MADFIIAPSKLTSILSAANLLVSTLAEAPVESLDTGDLNADVNTALLLLDQADLMMQMRGWSWNTDLALKFDPDGAHHINLPDEALIVALSEYNVQPSGKACDVVPRGSLLYDRLNHTTEFTESLYLDITTRLSWDQLPQAARSYVAYTACQAFHARMTDRTILLRVTADDIRNALVPLEQMEDRYAPKNSVKGNPQIAFSLFGGLRRRGV